MKNTTKTVLANTLKVGDTIRVAEGDRKICAVGIDEGVVITLIFENDNSPHFMGKNSFQELVLT